MNRSDNRRSAYHSATPNVERGNRVSEREDRRLAAPHASDQVYPWGSGKSSYSVSGRNRSRVGVSAPSAAATARRDSYIPNHRIQSSYQAGSLASRNHDAGSFAGQKSKAVQLPKQAFKPGMIVRALIHEATLDKVQRSSVTITDAAVTETKYGLVTSKWRKLIVIATHQDHFNAIPLYTHNGRGLSRKSNPDEYISIRDHRQTKSFTALSVHLPLVTGHLNSDIFLFDPLTTAHIPYMISMGYVSPVVHEGSLESESTKRLLKLIGTF